MSILCRWYALSLRRVIRRDALVGGSSDVTLDEISRSESDTSTVHAPSGNYADGDAAGGSGNNSAQPPTAPPTIAPDRAPPLVDRPTVASELEWA
jgi:hypothetical protein